MYKTTKQDAGKEFTIKFLPNIDNLQRYIIQDDKYWVDGKEVTRIEYFKEFNNGNPNTRKVTKYYSMALVNGTYKILMYGAMFKKFIKFALTGVYYKVSDGDFLTQEEYDEYNDEVELENCILGDIKDEFVAKNNITKIDLGGQVNMFDLANDWTLKYTATEKDGYLFYKDLRLEKDPNYAIWDGKEESKSKLEAFLKDKNFTLENCLENVL